MYRIIDTMPQLLLLFVAQHLGPFRRLVTSHSDAAKEDQMVAS